LQIEGLYDSVPFFFILTDYKPGGDLFHQLRRFDKFSEYQVYHIAKSIINSVVQYHKLNKILLNLRPENILIDSDGETHINLYESSKFNIGERSKGRFALISNYIAPELLVEKAKSPLVVTKAVDYWSLGIIIYELLVGVTPFQCSNLEETKVYLKNLDVFFPDEVKVSPE
jgi:serine/threonine protein kinase